MDRRPEIYTALLNDLQMIKEELPRITFSNLSGHGTAMGRFEPNINTLFMPQRARAESTTTQATIVHEMDHALTANQRTSHSNPEFAFGLDFSRPPNKVLRYNATHAPRSLSGGSIFGEVYCSTAEGRAASLADEVHAAQTQARYLLFRLGVTPKELEQMRRARDQRSVVKILDPKIDAAVGESRSDFDDVKANLLYYFGKGGTSGRGDLADLITFAYERVKDPRFVDTPGCIPITR